MNQNDQEITLGSAQQTPPATTEQHEFYVVSPTKFLTLFIGTFGFYEIYWFYKNWQLHKIKHNLKIWPIPRAIFSIFFAHSLFREVDQQLKKSKKKHAWKASLMATVYVLCTMIGRFIDRFIPDDTDNPYALMFIFSFTIPVGYSLFSAQKTINISQNDPKGLSNSKFTWANIVWLILGGVLWLMILTVLFLMMFMPELLVEP